MIVSSVLGLLASLSAAPGGDASATSRNAYTACLRSFMDKSVQDKTSVSAFERALPQQCADQERAFREAVRVREAAYNTPAAEVDEIITMEIEDARTNMKQLFELSTTPR